jgi:hypothetical protein
MTQLPINHLIDQWLESCRQRGKIARNTVAVGIVVLHRLRQNCPLTEQDVFSRGGELSGARSMLPSTLELYGVPRKYLKEATNRQVAPNARKLLDLLQWGGVLPADAASRETTLTEAIGKLTSLAHEWLSRQHLKVNCDRKHSPVTWIGSILEQARERSGGKVEQHLVGAKLERRFPTIPIANNPGHAGDVQTGRPGDFSLGTTVYHVTAAPARAVVEKCGANLRSGLHPVLLVPRDAVSKAIHIAEDASLEERITIVAIEDFLALNILEMSEGNEDSFIQTLREIIDTYNRRLGKVETDLSLRIELE